jgi:hypothetical protein
MKAAATLSWNENQSKKILSTSQITDLSNFLIPFDMRIDVDVLTGIIEILDVLKGFIPLVVSDLLSIDR